MSPETFRRRVGARIQRARWRLEWTQADAAHRVGLTFRYFAEVERGKRNPTLDVLFSIARGLKVRVADLVDIEPGTPIEHFAEHDVEIAEASDLARLLGTMHLPACRLCAKSDPAVCHRCVANQPGEVRKFGAELRADAERKRARKQQPLIEAAALEHAREQHGRAGAASVNPPGIPDGSSRKEP